MGILSNGLKRARNIFTSRDPTKTKIYHGSFYRPEKTRRRIQNERSIVNAIINRFASDCATIDIKHVRVNEDGNFEEVIKDSLNDIFCRSANLDQSGRAFILDAVYSVLDDGCVALVPIEYDGDIYQSESYTVETCRVGKIVNWAPEEITVEVYNELSGRREEITLPKRIVPIIENPFSTIMNEPNSTLQRLIRVLNQLDRMNQEIAANRIDLIVKLPYSVKNPSKQKLAESRREDIIAQLTNSSYGIAYIDSTEQVIQLNRPVENNFWSQAKELKEDLFSQMGISLEILNGTADEKTMTNYYSRIIEPILTFFVEEIERKWISKTARTQGQAIRYFRDPFKLVPVGQMGDVADKFRRNEIMSSNEIRSKLGLPPSKDERADELANPNLNQPEDKNMKKRDREYSK